MTDHVLSPSKITAWLDCAHFLTLKHQVEAGTLAPGTSGFGSLAQLLVDKGLQHESDCLAAYSARGLDVFEVPERGVGESFASWVTRIGDPFASAPDVVYQMPFLHDGVRGIADFLVRTEEPRPGFCKYEPVDAKLARSEGKPGHVLQLCFYADALESMTGTPPRQLHLWLGSGHTESLTAVEFQPYWRRLRGQLALLLEDVDVPTQTVPRPCAHCDFCEFQDNCTAVWRDEDSLTFVAGIRKVDQALVEESGVATLGTLASHEGPIQGIQPERLRRLVDQAILQVRARSDESLVPPYEVIPPSDDPVWGRGFELLPEPDVGDVFLDFEGDPFWKADVGLFFLLGLIARSDSGTWEYLAFWSDDRDAVASSTYKLIDYLHDRRTIYPAMHVYHYNHTERSSLERLAAEHGVGESRLASMIETGLFVDLQPVVRNSVQIGIESYGLKQLERVTGYVRGHEIDRGSGAVVEYEKFLADHDEERLRRIASYNEDDVRSTRVLRDWLVSLQPDQLPWRSASFEPEEGSPEFDARVEHLHAFGPDSPEHLLGDLLGYWWREWRAHIAPLVAKTTQDTLQLLDDPEAIAGLSFEGMVPRIGKRGKVLEGEGAEFRWPAQDLDSAFGPDRSAKVLVCSPDGLLRVVSIDRIDLENRELVLKWSDELTELGVIPTTVVLDDWVNAGPKAEAVVALADRVIAPTAEGAPNEVSMELLRRSLPRFNGGNGPPDCIFTDDVEEICGWAGNLDRSYVAIQGPPGTGKTYRGAHIVHALVSAGQRVGITAMSHNAIDNLLAEVVTVFADKGDSHLLKCIRKNKKPADGGLPGVTYKDDIKACASDRYNLVAGTTWLFAGPKMADAPVDVLIVDEAGQLALADALAASRSAKNVILLGDPLQLPQVSQADHPGGAGRSVLEHIMGDNATLPPDRGVFLEETRRMHPDICRFISEEIYEGRLRSHPSCEVQDTGMGTGLRWIEAHHADRRTESIEEAEIVSAEITRLLGTTWTDKEGVVAPLTVDDIMVVAPYNDQVGLIRAHLDGDPSTHGVQVGTVDKFQGREAPVVFFTMTTSSADDMPRGPEFLFSRNRLNVAVSRARCLAYLVCTNELLNSRARSVEEMRLLSTLCAFVEHTLS